MLLGAVHLGHLVFVEHTKVPDERRQSGPEPGRSDHSVDLLPRAIGEERRAGLESLQGRNDANAAVAHRRDDADVEDRERSAL